MFIILTNCALHNMDISYQNIVYSIKQIQYIYGHSTLKMNIKQLFHITKTTQLTTELF